MMGKIWNIIAEIPPELAMKSPEILEILKSIPNKGLIPAGDARIMSELASKAATNMAFSSYESTRSKKCWVATSQNHLVGFLSPHDP